MYSRSIDIIEQEVAKHQAATRREDRKLIEAKIDGMFVILTCIGVFSQLDVKNFHYKLNRK